MHIRIDFQGVQFEANLSEGMDISIPLVSGSDAPNCFWAPHFIAEPVVSGDWIGDTSKGGNLNFKTVTLNPHGNGTHTECVGHISKEKVTINQVLKNFHHVAQVITIYPQVLENGDRMILKSQIEGLIVSGVKALVLRTMPNFDDKQHRIYSGTNPAYVHHEAIAYIVSMGIDHFLLDLPSVDREQDDGKLLSHKAFWNYPAEIDTKKTISEMVYVVDSIKDGIYLLNLQIVSFELDASPSKPVLYKLKKIET